MNSGSLGYGMSALSEFSVTPKQQVKLLDAASILLSGVAFALFAGVSGILAGVGLVVLRYVSTRLITFALGHFLWVAVLPELSVFQLAVVEIGLLPLLIAALQTNSAHSHSPEWLSLWFIAICGGLLGVVAGLYVWLESLLSIATVFTISVVTTSYVLHRYEQVTLGLIADSKAEVKK